MDLCILTNLLSTLSEKRPVFLMEYDFQYELGKCLEPFGQVIFEAPLFGSNSGSIDLLLIENGCNDITAYELKYLTSPLNGNLCIGGINYIFPPRGFTEAVKSFYTDINRLDSLLNRTLLLRTGHVISKYFSVFLSNYATFQDAAWFGNPVNLFGAPQGRYNAFQNIIPTNAVVLQNWTRYSDLTKFGVTQNNEFFYFACGR